MVAYSPSNLVICHLFHSNQLSIIQPLANWWQNHMPHHTVIDKGIVGGDNRDSHWSPRKGNGTNPHKEKKSRYINANGLRLAWVLHQNRSSAIHSSCLLCTKSSSCFKASIMIFAAASRVSFCSFSSPAAKCLGDCWHWAVGDLFPKVTSLPSIVLIKRLSLIDINRTVASTVTYSSSLQIDFKQTSDIFRHSVRISFDFSRLAARVQSDSY